MKKYWQNLRRKKGTILIDVIFSIFIFTIGLTGSMSLLVSAVQINTATKERIIALNLAREGIEAVRNMRDTNWMTWSTDVRGCWNFWDDTNEDGAVDALDSSCIVTDNQNNHPFGKSNLTACVKDYIVNFNSDHRWILIEENSNTQLYQNANGFYVHDSVGNTETPYSREINLTYIDTDDGCFPVGEADYDNRILVTSKVLWLSAGVQKQVVFAEVLTDYYEREGFE